VSRLYLVTEVFTSVVRAHDEAEARQIVEQFPLAPYGVNVEVEDIGEEVSGEQHEPQAAAAVDSRDDPGPEQ